MITIQKFLNIKNKINLFIKKNKKKFLIIIIYIKKLLI